MDVCKDSVNFQIHHDSLKMKFMSTDVFYQCFFYVNRPDRDVNRVWNDLFIGVSA